MFWIGIIGLILLSVNTAFVIAIWRKVDKDIARHF